MEDLPRHLEQQYARGRPRSRRPRHSITPAPTGGTRGLVSHAAGEAAWHWDLGTGRVVRGGALVQTCGYAAEEIPPDFAWWRERIHPDDRASVLAALDAALSGERRELVLLYRFRRKDGGTTLLLDRAFVLNGEKGTPERIVGFLRELSDARDGKGVAGGPETAAGPPDPSLTLERDQLASLSRGLVESVEGERRRVSRELHDEIGQLLTSLRILLHSGPDKRDRVEEILDEVFARVRDISMSLRPPMLEDMGLGTALSWQCQRFADRTGVDVNLLTSGLERRYSPDVELAVFRVVQEALTNVARHAGISSASVAVRGGERHLSAIVLDNGRGFDPGAVREEASGLTGMRERVASLGGRLHVFSTPGHGTRVSLMIPIRREVTPSPDEVPR